MPIVPIVLFRADERLIHGQVVVGWGARLQFERIVVVDDDLARSPWEQELYRLGVPPEIEVAFVTVEAARSSWGAWQAAPQRSIVLVRDISTLRRLAAGSLLDGIEVNLGGIHHAPGRDRLLPYLFLSREERAQLEEVSAQGVTISARDLPGSRAVPLHDLLEEKAE